jgi:hypothetical protein
LRVKETTKGTKKNKGAKQGAHAPRGYPTRQTLAMAG